MQIRYYPLTKLVFQLPLLSPAFFNVSLNLISLLGYAFVFYSDIFYSQIISQFIAVILAFISAFLFSRDSKGVYKIMLDPNIVNSLITSKRHISLFNAFFVLIQLIVIINLFINGNFLSFDSSSRFTTVRFAPLHNISLHLSCCFIPSLFHL